VTNAPEVSNTGVSIPALMNTLASTVDGLQFANPFLIASGPPGTNFNVISRAFREGWGGVVAKTVSLDASKVVNVSPRYATLTTPGGEVVGWENIELISDRPLEIWLEEFRKCKDLYPEGILIASIMEEFRRDAWIEIVERLQQRKDLRRASSLAVKADCEWSGDQFVAQSRALTD
jgi:dihydroorotate dehydrogenase